MWPADPRRITTAAATLAETVRGVAKQLAPGDDDQATGSTLWTGRSRHRQKVLATAMAEGAAMHLDRHPVSGRMTVPGVVDVLAGLADRNHHLLPMRLVAEFVMQMQQRAREHLGAAEAKVLVGGPVAIDDACGGRIDQVDRIGQMIEERGQQGGRATYPASGRWRAVNAGWMIDHDSGNILMASQPTSIGPDQHPCHTRGARRGWRT